jgi:probable phosphoglycerate mutase
MEFLMAELPTIYLVRHGATAWSVSGQHTGRTDLPLTKEGEDNARRIGERLRGQRFEHVGSSPLQRALNTCRLAGFGDRVEIDPDLLEWNYGDYEGKTSAEIRQKRPDWHLFREGCPGGESVADVTTRADRFVAKLRRINGRGLVFSSGHILRTIGARWCELEPATGARLYLSTGSISILGYDHARDEPVLRFWNDTNHLASP